MLKVAYVMLAHEPSAQVAYHVDLITTADPAARVFVHYDRKVSEAERQSLAERLAGNERARLIADRVRCDWGMFGLVQAALSGLREIAKEESAPDYVYLISGSCLPIRPLSELNRYLKEHYGTEFIQAQNERWITGGLTTERFRYYFPVCWQKNRGVFDKLVQVQRRIGVNRTFPKKLKPRFGSQWWCLTWTTCQAILNFIDANPDVLRFFRLTWIPDECFFQTLVHHVAGSGRIANKTLTMYRFGATGKPLVFFDDHEAWLFSQNFFFARKISPEAVRLKQRISKVSRALDRGRPMRAIGRITPFYDAAIWLRAKRERPGQMFRSSQRRFSYPGALARNENPYIILFGPHVATRVAADALRHKGVHAFGRLFDPKRVDLGPYADDVQGLAAGDVAIRDFDPSLYLARTLARSARCPAFEQTMWDHAAAAYLAHDDPNCLFVACLPRPDLLGRASQWDEERWKFFLSLCLLDADSPTVEFAAAWSELIDAVGDDRLSEYEVNNDQPQWEEILAWARNKGLVQDWKPNFMILPWGGGTTARATAIEAWQSVQERWEPASEVPPGAIESAVSALSELGMEEAVATAPRVHRANISRLMQKVGFPRVRRGPRAIASAYASEHGADVVRMKNAAD